MTSDEDPPFCVTCKHHVKVLVSPMQISHGCDRLGLRDIVSGQPITQHCLGERVSKEKGACGWKAQYWERKFNG